MSLILLLNCRERRVFRVFVVIPLLPNFEGDVTKPSGTSIRAIIHWNYQSIWQGSHSIFARLKASGIKDPKQYISFHSLRAHTVLNGKLVTVPIYVHSKLLIADDKVVICGSANINDRSMLGTRDSEVAVIIRDVKFENGMMNKEFYPSGLFAGRLRKFLFQEHLGCLDRRPFWHTENMIDPISSGNPLTLADTSLFFYTLIDYLQNFGLPLGTEFQIQIQKYSRKYLNAYQQIRSKVSPILRYIKRFRRFAKPILNWLQKL